MKIRFKKMVTLSLVNVATGEPWDEVFKAGSEFEGKVLEDQSGYITIGEEHGVKIVGLNKEYFEVISVPEKSTWPFPDQPEPQWYREQTLRWAELCRQGWKWRSRLGFIFVTMRMERGDVSAEFAVPKTWEFQTIHTWMLERCEEFARAK